jgi:hypothetical protein
MFKGDSADKFAGKFLLVSMGGRAEGLASQTRERGPPSALVEFVCCLVLSPFVDYLELLINVSLRKFTGRAALLELFNTSKIHPPHRIYTHVSHVYTHAYTLV